MSTKDLNTAEEFAAYLNELRINYHFSCYKENNAEACHLLGDWYSQKKMVKEAISQYKHACEKYQYPRSCYKYGVSCVDGAEIGGETDIKKALYYTAKACDLGELDGCWGNAQILQQERRFPEAIEQLMKYCNKGHFFSHNACFQAGLIFRSKPEITSVPTDLKKAFEYFNKGCLLGNFKACHEVAAAYYHGRGVEKDLNLAKDFKKKAHDLQNVASEDEK